MTHHGHRSTPISRRSAQTMAQGLGWFSIGLGAVEILAPRTISRAIGMRGHEALLQTYGLREIATGIGILSTREPQSWMWGRVGGDAIDLGTLATRWANGAPRRQNIGIAMAAVAGVTALDVLCAIALSGSNRPRRIFDYSRRSGFPASPAAMRGAAADFEVPEDFRTPHALRPWDESAGEAGQPSAHEPRTRTPSLEPA